ncbi:IPT/TIG domain-containing protein [Parapedobacter sp.]
MKTNILKIYLCTCILLAGSCEEEESAPINTAPIPRILALEPANAAEGDTLAIVGINFSENATENEVKFGQSIIETIAVSDTLIQVVVPAMEGNIVGVSVRSRGKISNKQNLSLVRTKVFEDNFDRPDIPSVGSPTVPNPLGTNWQIINGKFSLNENRLFSSEGGLESYMLYRDADLDMQVGDGSYFELTATMSSSPESFAGIIFNAQSDNKRFYLLRTTNNMLQLLKTGENGLGHWVNIMVNQTFEGFAPNVPYQVTVSSSQPGNFRIKVTNKDTNGILFEQAVEDPAPYLGGSPGVYYFGLANPVVIAFDDFHLELL